MVAPAYTFVSTKVQDVLTREAEVVKDDPVLAWLLLGMPSSGPFTDPNEMRRLVLGTDPELTHSYPDVVAEILRYDDTYEGTSERLRLAETAMRPFRKQWPTIAQAIAHIPIKPKEETW